ncbi:phage lytic cycle repressor MrpR family protein [Niallia taxi]|uniref:phage lytic cycle repressor MrpR family protein n=1 Tax=Niallia taxi TaxID=2499688 RepID=UPI003F60C150
MSKSEEDKMFNSADKEAFMEYKGYSKETKRVTRILFGKIAKIEREKNQDIYEFDRQSIELVLNELKASTIRSLQNSISTIEQYINYAIHNGKISTDKGNVASFYGKKEDIAKFLNTSAEDNMILTQGDIYALGGYAENAQDGVILNLLFDGISHKRKFVELRNIRIQNVNEDTLTINIPQLVDEDTGELLPSRTVPISKETLQMINAAMKEKKYASVTGKTSRSYKIAESDYILRGLRNNFQIKWENVSQRIIRIADLEGYPYLNATNIAYSGQVHYTRELMQNQGQSIDEACRNIMKRFNISYNDAAFFYLKARVEKATTN